MAEASDLELEKQLRRIRLMVPCPKRTFDAYKGRPAAEGSIVRICSTYCLPYLDSGTWCLETLGRHAPFASRVDCAFDPYSENWVTASVDVQALSQGPNLLCLNKGPYVYMSRVTVENQQRVYVPFRRSAKSVSTAFACDGNRIAWLGYTSYSLYNRALNLRESISQPKVRCGTFSPDGNLLALLSVEGILLRLTIIDSHTYACLTSASFILEHQLENRLIFFYHHSPCYLLWSKCGNYLGVSTAFGEFAIIKMHGLFEDDSDELHMIFHDDFLQVSNPRAYDFSSHTSGPNQEFSTLALGISNTVRLYQLNEIGLGQVIKQADFGSKQNQIVINCLRFSNAEHLLAVAMSDGAIQIVDGMTLSLIKNLQLVTFSFKVPLTIPSYNGFTSLSFACTDNFLAAGATDGLLRVWCVRRPTGPLKSLCRTAIRRCCLLENMSKLPLPSSLVSFLSEIDFN